MNEAAAAPEVSVLMPARDAEATVGRAIASIAAQAFERWELIVVDDGSRDGTAAVLADVARTEPRLRVLRQERAGIVAALNLGLTSARAGLIARMDADDVAHPERLAEQVAFLNASQNRAIGLVSCLVEFGGDRAASAGYALHVDWSNALLTPEDIRLNRFVESPLAHPSVMFRRELVVRFGGYRAGDFPEDYELWLRWLDAGVRMAKVPRALLRWNDPPGRLSRHDARYASEAFFQIKAEWIAREVARVGNGRAVWVWGAGRPTRKRAAHLERHGLEIAGYIDVDAKKVSTALGGRGRPVRGVAELPAPNEAFVLSYVSSRGARDSIGAALRARGYGEGDDFLLCA